MPMEVPDNDSFHTCFVIDQCVRHEQWKRKLIQITKIYQMLNSVCFIHWCGDVEADNHMFCVEFIQCHRCICTWCEQRAGMRPTSHHTNVILAFTHLAQNIAFKKATNIHTKYTIHIHRQNVQFTSKATNYQHFAERPKDPQSTQCRKVLHNWGTKTYRKK